MSAPFPDPASPLILPERISGLATLARNLKWSWSHDTRALFRSIDQTLWHLTRHNPIELLRRGARIRGSRSVDGRYVVRHGLPGCRPRSGGVLLRRVRAAQLRADLFGRAGGAVRRPLQGR